MADPSLSSSKCCQPANQRSERFWGAFKRSKECAPGEWNTHGKNPLSRTRMGKVAHICVVSWASIFHYKIVTIKPIVRLIRSVWVQHQAGPTASQQKMATIWCTVVWYTRCLFFLFCSRVCSVSQVCILGRRTERAALATIFFNLYSKAKMQLWLFPVAWALHWAFGNKVLLSLFCAGWCQEQEEGSDCAIHCSFLLAANKIPTKRVLHPGHETLPSAKIVILPSYSFIAFIFMLLLLFGAATPYLLCSHLCGCFTTDAFESCVIRYGRLQWKSVHLVLKKKGKWNSILGSSEGGCALRVTGVLLYI